MQVVDHLELCPRPPEGCVVTIGNFDGVHAGHRAVIAALADVASEIGAHTAIVTFEPHTLEVLRPDAAPPRLTALDRKLELLAETGLDFATVLTFDSARAAQPAEQFVAEVLVGCLHARIVMVGEDFRFGHGAKGDIELLRKLGEADDFVVEPVQIVAGPSGPYSSTAVRRAIVQGRVEDAADALCRPYDLRGEVVAGDRRGRGLGFPTANVVPPSNVCIPANGVYAGRVRRVAHREVWYPAVINVGVRPTFKGAGGDARVLVEAHLLDWSGDLYGEEVDVAFSHRLRDERRFDSVDALKACISADVDRARDLLS